MRVLLTGSDSILGRELASSLAALKDVSLRLLHGNWEELAVPEGTETQSGDIRDPAVAALAVADTDAVVHLQPWSLARLEPADDAERLDTVMRGTRSLALAAAAAGARRLILGSTLSFFDRHPAHWHVDELWRPRPVPELRHLLPWIGELAVRELVRLSRMEAVCLRFGEVVDDASIAGRPFDPRWVHAQDAVRAAHRALEFNHDEMLDSGLPDWSVFHIMGAGPHSKIRHGDETGVEERTTSASPPFSYKPQVDFSKIAGDAGSASPERRSWQEILAPPAPIPSRPIRNVVVFGAGGPLGASVTRDMEASYTLRLADLRSMPDAIEVMRRRTDYEFTIPRLAEAPHESRVVDVRDPQQVMDACEGMDAIINCSVLREDPVEAFRVSAVGAYNMARAAAHHGIRRFVQTGPLLHLVHGHGSHLWDYQVPVEAPSRPYASLYFLSKYLGQEILRVFAEHYDLEVLVMLYWEMVNPAEPDHKPPFFVSWPDAGRALRRAVEAADLPSCYEEFNVSVDLPHGKFDHSKMRRVLGWQPLDNMDHFWQDASGPGLKGG